jgi:hypothetical protein
MSLGAAGTVLLGALGAQAGNDSCREWQKEHCEWKARALRRYLHGAPQRELDAAVFEVLQREAYLTSCDVSARVSRGAMVGWRLVARAPDEYGSAVLESLLERSGFDVGLRDLLRSAIGDPRPAAPAANIEVYTQAQRQVSDAAR